MRLTYRDNTVPHTNAKGELWEAYSDANYNEVINKLAAYEDAEEQGLLVRLPCKVGDMTYVVWNSSIYPENPPAVREDHITQVKFTKKGYAFKTWRGWYHKSDIGKTVFLTHEEAEAALKGETKDV
jgi:hypothetical protein